MRTLVLLLLLAQTDPVDVQGWVDLGTKRHEAGDFKAAIEAFEKARAMRSFGAPLQLNLRLARAYARAGESEKALVLLRQTVDAGFSMSDRLTEENDLLSIRTDKRWPEIVAKAKANQSPCRNAPEYRQLDYWLGEWDVEMNGTKIATSSIQLILEECVIFENYYATNYSGKSLSAWDASQKRWEQQYTDTAGGSRSWIGGLEGDRMVFYLRGQGPAVNRMSYIKDGPDRVRQLIEVSIDGEKTWSAGYNGVYIRRK